MCVCVCVCVHVVRVHLFMCVCVCVSVCDWKSNLGPFIGLARDKGLFDRCPCGPVPFGNAFLSFRIGLL